MRSIWNGAIRLGLVSVPIKVHSATEDKSIHFHLVHAQDGARIEHKRVCPREGKPVPYEEIVKGYEIAPDEYVVLTKSEIDAAAGPQSRTIELEEFVPTSEIDPVFYERTYYLGVRDQGDESYRLLHDALSDTARAGIGRWVFHNREYLVAVRALDGVLGLHTLRFHDEVSDPRDMELPRDGRKPSKREIDMATTLVESLYAEFEPDRFEDTYRERVLEMIERKAAGEEVAPPEQPQPEEAPDLMAALEASLSGHSGGRKRRATSRSPRKARR